jgi:hypothetical protein
MYVHNQVVLVEPILQHMTVRMTYFVNNALRLAV